MNYNKAIIIGNITKDPELKSLPTGTKVCSFGVATNSYWTKDGQRQESTEFHNIVLFGKLAETVVQYMGKGSSIMIEGRIQTRSWESEGIKRYRTEIVGDNVQFGPKKGEGSRAETTITINSDPTEPTVVPEERSTTSPSEDYPEGLDLKDIPF